MEAIDLNDDGQNDVMDEDIEDHEVLEDSEAGSWSKCRRLYPLTVFRIFKNELVQSYNYLCLKTYEEGAVSRFLVRKESEKDVVTFSASNLSSSCSWKDIEFGTSSLEKYKLAYEIMREGGKKLCCQR
uniref:Uncharacterized protein n=1 Tax=Brassica campestris TaxID=3711 RepID=M4CDB6_BRACM